MSSSLKKYLSAQLYQIDVDKWLEGIRRNCDPGECYVLDWIKNNASKFRQEWDDSQCKNCKKECVHQLKKECGDFESEQVF